MTGRGRGYIGEVLVCWALTAVVPLHASGRDLDEAARLAGQTRLLREQGRSDEALPLSQQEVALFGMAPGPQDREPAAALT